MSLLSPKINAWLFLQPAIDLWKLTAATFCNRLCVFAVFVALFVGVDAAAETILVGGATGRQGNAVVDALLARGYKVRGLTRKPEGKKAQRLAAKGVEVMQGDYADSDSLLAAMQGIERVFFYSGFSRDEVAEGSNFIAAAKASGIKHLIYSSGAAAAPENGLAGAAKMLVELEILDSGVPYTILRPVAFMENFDRQQARTLQNGIRDSRDPERMLHFITIQDIGLLVAEAFENPGQWLGTAVNIAGDAMTVAEYVATFSRVLGQDVVYHQLPLDEYLEMFPQPLRPLFRWYDEVGYTADVKGLREQYPQLMTLEQYLRATGWENWKP
jgi:uncharacterized protein YbjT (DUF2867 family)